MAGGLVGIWDSGLISECSNTGTIEGNSTGGLAGQTSGSSITIRNCINRGTIHGGAQTGGLIGYASKAAISECENYGAVIGENYVGGLTGTSGILTDCCNWGNVSGDYQVGGLSGNNEDTITDCYNGGNVKGHKYSSATAGLVGYGSARVIRSGNGGTVSGKDTKPFVSYSSSYSCTDCYNFGSCNSVDYHPGTGSFTIGDHPGRGIYDFELTPEGLYLSGGSQFYCTDIRVRSARLSDNAQGHTLEELQQESTYASGWGMGIQWIMDPSKNSGLPMPANIPVDYLSDSVLFLTPGETSQLTASFPVARWQSENPVAASCADGQVTARSVGTAVVSAWLEDGRRANCIVFVYEPRKSLSFLEQAPVVKAGYQRTLHTDLPDLDPQGMIWSSSDPSVATVDQTGTVTGVMPGTTVISVELPLSGVSASCEVTVSGTAVTKVFLTSTSVAVGEQKALSYSISPSNGDPSLTWRSGDETIATVENGVVTGHKVGSTTITATAANGVSGSCTVTVTQPAVSVTLDVQALELEVGLTHQLTATVAPPSSTDKLTWNTSDYYVVSVSDSGLLTAKSSGTAVITVKTSSGALATCQVTVKPKAVLPQSVALSQTQARMAVGEALQLSAVITPGNTTNPALTWSSSAPEVVQVSSTGVLTALAPGSAEIRVETANGLYDLCQVKVAVTSSAGFILTDGRAVAGGTAETQVHIVKNPGIAAFTLEVTYDDTALTPLSVTAGDCLSGGTLTSNLDTLAPGEPFRLTWYSAQDTGDTGLAFTITWQTAEEAQDVPVSLSFAPSDICNSNQEEVGFTVQEGIVSILDRAVGDIYYDRAVNMKDIVYFARWFNRQEEMDAAQEQAADVWFDRTLDVKDLSALAQLLNSSLEPTSGLPLSSLTASEPYQVTVSDCRVDADGNAFFTVSGANCPGIAAFRFQLKLPEGYVVTDVQPDNSLPEVGNFSYNVETGIVSWYSSQTEVVNGELFTVSVHTEREIPLFGTLDLSYDSSDFFQAGSYTQVPVLVVPGSLTGEPAARTTDVSVVDDTLHVTVETNSSQTVCLIAASYTGNRMEQALLHQVELQSGTHTYVLPGNLRRGWDSLRIFLLDQNQIPLSELYFQKSN